MSRPLRSLMPLLRPALALLALQCFLIVYLLDGPDPLRDDFLPIHIGVTIFLAVFYLGRYRCLWRFSRYVRRFATVENARIVLHYEPELESREAIPLLLQSCQTELDDLTRWFGAPLRGRVIVYLFARWRDISAIFGPQYGGLAISQGNVIVIASDNNVPESMRHELVHLFSFRWNLWAPPFLSEGLSVCLQGRIWGTKIDAAALPILQVGIPRLSRFVQANYFFADSQRRYCYILAGSFTGFLIRRYGWDRYRRLYRRCNGLRFAAQFQKCFGVNLQKAERQWRNELIVMQIDLTRRLGRKPHC